MSGDFLDPFINELDELIACYQGTLKTVRLGLPVNYSKIIKFVTDLAEFEFSTVEDSK